MEHLNLKVPVCGDSRTTYNVGIVEGGTSINTIVPSAKILYEYRSDSAGCLASIAFGCCVERGAHTREEKVLISNIPIGMKIAALVILKYFEAY